MGALRDQTQVKDREGAGGCRQRPRPEREDGPLRTMEVAVSSTDANLEALAGAYLSFSDLILNQENVHILEPWARPFRVLGDSVRMNRCPRIGVGHMA